MASQVSPLSSLRPACRARREGLVASHRNVVAGGSGDKRARRSVWWKGVARPALLHPTPRASDQPAISTAAAGGVIDVNRDTFWPAIDAAGDKLVVLDMYTQWCGPCKIMHPKIAKLSEKYTDVVFLKLDCNQENKSLAKELGVRVVPTFKLFSKRTVIAVVAGAKFDELVETIDRARAGQL